MNVQTKPFPPRNLGVKIFNELSYCGSRKKEIHKDYDKRFGPHRWATAHFYKGRIITIEEAYGIYGEAYYEFLKKNPEIKKRISNTASEVFDIDPSNIDSGLDFTVQECTATHLQDIAVRRALTRVKLEEERRPYDLNRLPKIQIFRGDSLIQIRGHKTEGYYLSPGKVPFHKPSLILDTDQSGGWDKNSVEDWYQKSKVLLVDPRALVLELVMFDPPKVLFSNMGRHYYSTTLTKSGLSRSLRLVKRDREKEWGESPIPYSFMDWREKFNTSNLSTP